MRVVNAAVLLSFVGQVASAFLGARSGSTSGRHLGALFAKPKVFIDGEAGTTGLQVNERLAKRDDLEVISIDPAKRKDETERKKMINDADAVILCESASAMVASA